MNAKDDQSTFDLRILFDEEAAYEDMAVEIYSKDRFVCLISQENGFDGLEIEMHARADGQPRRFKLSAFESVVAQAKKMSLGAS